MKHGIEIALIGILGTAIGALIPSFFNYFSKKSEHKIYIRQMRAERAYTACEKLIANIYLAEYGEIINVNGKDYYVSHLLQQPENFIAWYAQFVDTWYPKQYILSDKSFEACAKLHSYLFNLTDEHSQLIGRPSIKPLTQEQLLKSSEELRVLLDEAHKALEAFLRNDIEEI